jgi:hypothetical protein
MCTLKNMSLRRGAGFERVDLLGGFLEMRDQIVPILCLFQAGEGHFRAWDVFFGVLKVIKLQIHRQCHDPFRFLGLRE